MDSFQQESKIWWYEYNGQQFGPLTEKEIVALFQVGTIKEETPVWEKNMATWVPLKDVPSLKSAIKYTKSVKTFNHRFDQTLEALDNGSFFKKAFYWIFKINAYLSIIWLLWILYLVVESGVISRVGGQEILILLLMFFGLGCITVLQFLLWNKRSLTFRKTAVVDRNFSASPSIAYFIQTCGESMCLSFVGSGVYMVLMALLTMLISEDFYRIVERSADGFGLIPLLFTIVGIGFFLLVLTRLIAETIKALAIIAQNTSKK